MEKGFSHYLAHSILWGSLSSDIYLFLVIPLPVAVLDGYFGSFDLGHAWCSLKFTSPLWKQRSVDRAVGRRHTHLVGLSWGLINPSWPTLPQEWKPEPYIVTWISTNPPMFPSSFILSVGLSGRPLPVGSGANMYWIPNGNDNSAIRIQIRAEKIYFSGSGTHSIYHKAKNVRISTCIS